MRMLYTTRSAFEVPGGLFPAAASRLEKDPHPRNNLFGFELYLRISITYKYTYTYMYKFFLYVFK